MIQTCVNVLSIVWKRQPLRKSLKKSVFGKNMIFVTFSMSGITSHAHATKNAIKLKRISSEGKGKSVLV